VADHNGSNPNLSRGVLSLGERENEVLLLQLRAQKAKINLICGAPTKHVFLR
jgi:hypothetical protein